ncbi:TATA box-binding protein-associated factor RNA polymerase I subunit B [Aulostomus maculatus]
MDEEQTAGYSEPCVQCSAVDWGVSDEGRFYCRTCHNVIERTREVVDSTFMPGSTRISTIGRGPRTKRPEQGSQWMICEAFQFILRNQAVALLRLGVSTHFKDGVLCQLWRLYLQRTQQAYTSKPVRSSVFKLGDSDSDSAAEPSVMSASATDDEMNVSSCTRTQAESSSDWSTCSGSTDAIAYLSLRHKRSGGLMSMRKTLALIHLALVWSREALTLSDLLRLVDEGHVPYVNAYEDLPEEMRLYGRDTLIFTVQSTPSHREVHKEAQVLLHLLELPTFPPITSQNLLHPALLSLRYLTEANLPDEIHPWVCRLMEHAGMADQKLHTWDHVCCRVLPRYDLQAAALIIVTVKVLFGLDDHSEWALSNKAGQQDGDPGSAFSLRRWYRLLQAALLRAQQKQDQLAARRVSGGVYFRKQWTAKNPLQPQGRNNSVLKKKKRVAQQVQSCFEKLSSLPAGVRPAAPSSFRFCWGDQEGADGPSLHHQTLSGIVTLKHDILTPSNTSYWHPPLRRCYPSVCRSHYPEVEPSLPRSFVWLLKFFSFLLQVKSEQMYEEVLSVERRVFTNKTPKSHPTKTPSPGARTPR